MSSYQFTALFGSEYGESKSILPVSWPTMAVGHSQDQNGSIGFSINHQERKTGKFELAGAASGTRPAVWRFENPVDRLVEFSNESCCSQRAALTVPAGSRKGFFDGGRMKGE